MPDSEVFSAGFLEALQTLVNMHHALYPRVPPQGIYFEALVEKAFRNVRKPFTPIEITGPNQPRHDLLVDDERLSLKTETGFGTNPEQVTITKLCTTEREPWAPDVLVQRVLSHLDRYDLILMLRAVWKDPLIHYQLVDIPVPLLKLIEHAELRPVGRRKGRQSLGADVYGDGELVFHVHFDGSDGKCQIRGLGLRFCNVLRDWDFKFRD